MKLDTILKDADWFLVGVICGLIVELIIALSK